MGIVEDIYTRTDHKEHVLLRPDPYIGSVEFVNQPHYVLSDGDLSIIKKDLRFVPGLLTIFDEILVNAADNKIRDPNMRIIKVNINREEKSISIYNDGCGIPIVIHRDERIYVPEMIFGNLLTSSNYDDNKKKVTGGRNGYGAKLTNIFSTMFIVETANKQYGKKYKQVFTNNMTSREDPQITSNILQEFTRITFYPDFQKFHSTNFDDDLEALLKRRAYDIAGTLKGVNIFLNNKEVPIKNFIDYIQLYANSVKNADGSPTDFVYHKFNNRWEVGFAASEGQFHQVSFVNSICTSKGGTHVDYVVGQTCSKLVNIVKKKFHDCNIKHSQVKNHIWIFINCLIENPAFDSQTKEQLVSPSSSFGSKCDINEVFMKKVIKLGIIEKIITWIKEKQNKQLKKTDGSKRSSVTVPKLVDAHQAGKSKSKDCTLILTEGDSAKSLAISGLSVLGPIGGELYGVFPLRGKLLNVREASHDLIMRNEEISNLKQILGLKEGHTYTSTRDLRYGHLMIMTDQDHDGSHIKGLIINFIEYFFPSLLTIPNFLSAFITPLIKVKKIKGKKRIEKSFYTNEEFEEWKEKLDFDIDDWLVKYYKGLGTSSHHEAEDYFNHLDRHQKPFRQLQPGERELIQMAFSKNRSDERKEWIRNHQSGTYMDYSLPVVTFDDFINKELILFSIADNVRSIPSMVDGLKLGQRKILFSIFKGPFTQEIKVAQLSGCVLQHSAYHHGETSLDSTIINLAQDYVGSNNLNLLNPHGQFGTRHQGGKDAAAPRYISVSPHQLLRSIFNPIDDNLLQFLNDDGQLVEPEWYMPILPMVLVNGSQGIGTGWSSFIPNFNPRDIADNIRRFMNDEPMVEMHPWYRGFQGEFEQIAEGKYKVKGVVKKINDTTIEISELPIRVWTENYKEQLTTWMTGTDNIKPWIKDFKEYHTTHSVRFIINLTTEVMAEAEKEGLERKFKITSNISTANMVCFNARRQLHRYNSPQEILKEWCGLRLIYYSKRKEYLHKELENQLNITNNKLRFIQMIIKKELDFGNKTQRQLISVLEKAGFDPIPDYNYLLIITISSLTKEKVKILQNHLDRTRAELRNLEKLGPKDLCNDDLVNFLVAWDKFLPEQAESPGPTLHSSSSGRKRQACDSLGGAKNKVIKL